MELEKIQALFISGVAKSATLTLSPQVIFHVCCLKKPQNNMNFSPGMQFLPGKHKQASFE